MLELKRNFRKNLTEAEKVLWFQLKEIRYEKFRRQHGIGRYIVDFYHAKSMTVIEIDGKIHEDTEVQKNDKMREQYLLERGYKIIRFKNEEVLTKPNIITEKIQKFIQLA